MYLGLDLSCYTTSCAIADENGKIVYDERRLLNVPQGTCGLRQSEMIFEHIKNLKEIFPTGFFGIKAVGVSTRPRPVEGSYMPVFAAADSYAQVISRALGVKKLELTHQHGHIGAALLGNDALCVGNKRILGLHVSGGTTDVLAIELIDGLITKIDQLGQTSDISAGMLIDRTGVALGCNFPAGPAIEELAKSGEILSFPSRVLGCRASFSGAEAAVKRAIADGHNKEDIAAGVLRCVANTLEKLIRNALKETNAQCALLFGGVMCNGIIKDRLRERLSLPLYFAQRQYSSDNACGLASQAKLIFERKHT